MAARHHASLLLASLALVVGSIGCAAPSDADEAESSGEALSGRVTVGRVVQTAGDALRLRRSPSRETTQNIIGVLPKGTSVKILESAPNDGFYRVEVQDRAVTAKLRTSTGWVYGEYLSGDSEEPVDPDESRTGTWDVPTEMRAKLVVRRCAGTFAPSLEDAVAGRSPWAAVAFDTNTFSKGMKVKIAQLRKEAEDSAGDFDLRVGDIRLPTIYDIRRAQQGGINSSPQMTVNNSPVVNVYPAPGGEAAVGDAIDRSLGTGAKAAMRSAGII